ncbi:MAG: DNA-3-methyladenine glycosylase [Bacteroidota bacterium]|nr:DNA-3-methyladenine glycosylase [Candidatus Kapabacteria bacterium]MCS7302215.1 DNA-3-methyladenine glycosylase [Candidatus Kapabacteria bacterium]MCX7937525.1 DNA-3-methyladenine glycosylase [Chlorobiota bacterium]MDW8074835.1 DNA-3-methyladenine glycosylase [Bacteroidota bacterium]MDW8271474.1 DNA-3-methyladenine glycosylase [Bacteroidota bacterium]
MALPCKWFARETATVAKELIGTILVHQLPSGERLAARIVETEAYTPDDPASHSWRGMTQRNKAMFAHGGCLYVYRIYGVHECINIVTETEGIGAAVLLRAAEVVAGKDTIAAFRGRPVPPTRLLSGPANLARGLGFSVADNFRSCCGNGVWILPAFAQPRSIGVSGRIGISAAVELLLRFFDPDSPAVSAHRRYVTLYEKECNESLTLYAE